MELKSAYRLTVDRMTLPGVGVLLYFLPLRALLLTIFLSLSLVANSWPDTTSCCQDKRRVQHYATSLVEQLLKRNAELREVKSENIALKKTFWITMREEVNKNMMLKVILLTIVLGALIVLADGVVNTVKKWITKTTNYENQH